MIIGIGTDIVAIKRFQRFVDENNAAILHRLFTKHELEYCRPKKGSAASYAARFAAKEAFMKALGTGLRDGLSWQDMEIVNDHNGKPELRLSGRAEQLFKERGSSTAFLSLTHDGDYAVAMIVLEAL